MLNQGVSFGLLPGFSPWILGLVLVGLIIYAVKVRELWGRIGIGLIIVGGLGNLVSRIVHGGVLDYWNFLAIFYNNVWDWLIAVGVLVCLVQYIYGNTNNF